MQVFLDTPHTKRVGRASDTNDLLLMRWIGLGLNQVDEERRELAPTRPSDFRHSLLAAEVELGRAPKDLEWRDRQVWTLPSAVAPGLRRVS